MNNQTLPLPNPGDWCTVDAAALIIGVNRRTVARLVDRGVLRKYSFAGSERGVFLWKPEVIEYAAAWARIREGELRERHG